MGGEAFYQLYSKHPDFEYTLLLRNEERGKLFLDKYPAKDNIHLVYGSLDSEDVIEKAAADADIVVRKSYIDRNVAYSKLALISRQTQRTLRTMSPPPEPSQKA